MKTQRLLLTIAALAVILTNPALAQTWTQTSAPITNWTSVASSADGTKLVALVYGGPIYKSTNSGATWTITTAPITNWQAAAASADGTKLVAVVDGGQIYLSSNSGETWAAASTPATNWFAIASSVNGVKLVAVVGGAFAPFGGKPNGLIYTSTNSGATWTATSAPSADWTSVASSADGSKLLAVTFSALYFSTDSGTNWVSASTPITYLAVAACSGDFTKWVAGSSDPFHSGGGGWPIQTSTNSGATWTATLSPGPARPSIASSADGSHWVAATRGSVIGGGTGPVYISIDSAATWIATGSPSTIWSSVATSADGSKLVAAMNNGGIYTLQFTTPMIHDQPASQTVPAGSNVTFSVSVFGAAPLAYQWRFNATNLLGATNALLTLTNVQSSHSGTYAVLVTNGFGSVLSSNALLTVLPAVVITQPASGISTNGAVLNGLVTPGPRTTVVWFEWGADTNYGNATSAAVVGESFAPSAFSNAVTGLRLAGLYHYRAVASNSLGAAVGADATFVTAGPPLTQTSAPVTNWGPVASSADGIKLLAAGGGTIYCSTNSGFTWTPTSAPFTNWHSLVCSADGRKFLAFVYNGPIYTSTNAGATWTSSSAPAQNLVSVASSADATRLVAVGTQIYTSTNSAATWTQTSAPATNWWSVTSSADGSKLVAGGSGMIYCSANSGATWAQSSTPFEYWRSVASSADGSKLVAAANDTYPGYAGPIYTSTNSGVSWSLTSAPGEVWVSVASSADGTKLVAAAGLCNCFTPIYTSTDSGATWAPRAPGANWSSVVCSADGNQLVAVVNGGGIYKSQSTPPPVLSLAPSAGDLLLSWIVPSMNLVLQENPDLATTNWTAVTNMPMLNFTNLRNEVIVPPPIDFHSFYRLKH